MAFPAIAAAASALKPKGGGGDGESDFKMISFALSLMIIIPTLFILFIPSYSEDHQWENEIQSVQQNYYAQTGQTSTTEQNVWTLTGIYTPYSGHGYAYTPDGWVYGTMVNNDAPSQYVSTLVFPGDLVVAQAPNNLFYYISVPDTMNDIVVLNPRVTETKEINGVPTEVVVDEGQYYIDESGKYHITNTTGATVYSAVTFNHKYKSDIFFTSSSRTEKDGNYYYSFTGQRYVFQPISDYYTTVGGETTKVNHNSTSLSLIWYEYYTLSGIAGQLAISGSDKGISYLTSDDIVNAFNSSNYTSSFDMTFNSVSMHLHIRLDPSRLANGESIESCYNNGYWSVVVSSDAVVNSMIGSTYEFSAENILETLISLFTFHIADDYDIDGWIGTIASMMVTMPLYVCLISLCLRHPELWMFVAIMAAVQAVIALLDFDIFGGLFG